MTLEDEIIKAVGVHGAWKARLKSAIAAGGGGFELAAVRQDNQCEFGKWLYGLPADVTTSEPYKKVQRLHAAFHKEAGRVLEMALEGNKTEAEKSLAAGGAFAKTSSDLTAAMIAWKTTAKN